MNKQDIINEFQIEFLKAIREELENYNPSLSIRPRELSGGEIPLLNFGIKEVAERVE